MITALGQKLFGRRGSSDTQFDWPRFGLLVPLVAISWWSTTNGLLGIIEVGSGPPTVFVTLSICAVVLILTGLMSWTVGAIGRRESGPLRPLFVLGYGLLATISVGFGFGFYWSMIEARGAAQREAVRAIETTTEAIATSVLAVEESMRAIDSVATISAERAAVETEVGGTCQADAPAGRGPRYRLRQTDAATFTALNDRLRSSVYGNSDGTAHATWYQRLTPAEASLADIRTGALARADAGEAERLLAELSRELSTIGAAYETFRSSPTVGQTITNLSARAARGETGFVENGYAFTCPDPNLETSLRIAAAELEALPPLPPFSLQAPLGAEATVDAFRRLTNSVFNWPSWFDDPGTARADFDACMASDASEAVCAEAFTRRTAGMRHLGSRDIVPLLIAISVDLFIFLLSFSPFRRQIGRRADRAEPRLAVAYSLLGRQERKAESGPVNMLMEQLFWFRGSYHLALPVGSPGEPPLSQQEYRLGMSAPLLADAGLIEPTVLRLPHRIVRGWLARRYGRSSSRAIRKRHDIYRVHDGALAQLVSEFSQCLNDPIRPGTAQMVKSPKVGGTINRDWRFRIDSGRETPEPEGEAAPPSRKPQPEEGAESVTEPTPPVAPVKVAPEKAITPDGAENALARWMRTETR